MIKAIRATFKKLLSDNRGEDLTDVSSGLSKGAKAVIACAVITATAAGAKTMNDGVNDANDKATKNVTAPVSGQVGQTAQMQAPFR